VKDDLVTMKQWEEVAREADFTPGKMAVLCSISERQLQRLFKQHLHCTPRRWLRQLQCRLARQLIARGLSNKSVAAELHFSSPSHLCREFKKAFGISPQSCAPRHSGDQPEAPHKISKESWDALRHPVEKEL